MSVVVRMEMPENCLKCPLHEFGGVCLLKVEHTAEEWLNIDKRRPLNCPIICSLPEGHGRLIDADEFSKRAIGTQCFPEDDSRMLQGLVGESITIVPADAERSE